MKRFPSDDTILNYFRRFSQAEVELFWRPMWRWLISRRAQLEKGFSLDLDSTIFCHGASNKELREVTIFAAGADLVIIRSWRSWQKPTLFYIVGCAVEMPRPVKGWPNS